LSFSRTLDRGEKLFESYLEKAKNAGSTSLAGEDVWRLYDTYGFPVDLTRLMAEENDFTIDEKSFEVAKAKAKEMSKFGRGSGSSEQKIALDVHSISALETEHHVPKTADDFKYGKVWRII
jgi:alanyl-tRNA synthetase